MEAGGKKTREEGEKYKNRTINNNRTTIYKNITTEKKVNQLKKNWKTKGKKEQ